MANQTGNEPMLDMYLFESSQLLEQLEQTILTSEKSSCFSQNAINEIFRIMHTIKGSSAMMMFDNITSLSHSIEDLFYYIRDKRPISIDCTGLSDLVFEVVDFIKLEIAKIKNNENADGTADALIQTINAFLAGLRNDNPGAGSEMDAHSQPVSKNIYKAVIYFEDGCGMENIRAYGVIHNLKNTTDVMFYKPENIIDDDNSADAIVKHGFKIYLRSDYDYSEISELLNQTVFLKALELEQLQDDSEIMPDNPSDKQINPVIVLDATEENVHKEHPEKEYQIVFSQQSIVSVSVSKLDKLMDLVGEMVIAEAMVTNNPDLRGLELGNFHKAAQQLNKITSEIQDMVMSIRMVPLATTFHKMHRIVRDMCKKLDKDVELQVIGEGTEVDKNIIEHISDPLMHLVRNAIDHGIESLGERQRKNKLGSGTITLEAKNSGSDVLIMIRDDGKGLDKERILKKARENNLLYKAEGDMTDKEIFNLIFLPGFSTKDSVTEFSGRGVGMDVVTRNLETIGGSVSVESIMEKGTTIILKIPLTLAIIDGMNVKVGNSRYTLPTISIRESFRPKESDIITDPEGNEMIMVRGNCYPILRLHECYKVKTKITGFHEGILIMIEQDNKNMCIFADELIGQQQVVVKALPEYIRSFKKIKGLAGCTLLGDGSISLILDVGGLIRFQEKEF